MVKQRRPKPFAVGRVRVRVHSGPRKDGRWRWRADKAAGMAAGKERREPVWSGWGSRDEAEQAVIKALQEHPDVDTPIKEMRTVFDLLDFYVAYLEDRPDLSPRTVRHRRYCAERIGKHELGSVAISRLTARAMETYRDQVLRGGAAASTTREDLITVRAAWTWARERGHVPDRTLPVVKVRVRPQDAVYNRYTPSAAELVGVLRYLAQWPWARRVAYLLWATGARRQEVADLRWDQVDLEARLIRLSGKTGTRPVPLHPNVVAELRTWPRETELVHGVAPQTAAGAINERIRRACDALELPRWSVHGLRRAAVMRLYRGSVDPAVAGAIMGHSAKVALEHYRQVADADLADAVMRTGMGVLPDDEVIEVKFGKGDDV